MILKNAKVLVVNAEIILVLCQRYEMVLDRHEYAGRLLKSGLLPLWKID